MVQAIGFDLDDTLYDRDQMYRDVYFVMQNNVVRLDVDFGEFNEVYQEKSIEQYNYYMEEKNRRGL